MSPFQELSLKNHFKTIKIPNEKRNRKTTTTTAPTISEENCVPRKNKNPTININSKTNFFVSRIRCFDNNFLFFK